MTEDNIKTLSDENLVEISGGGGKKEETKGEWVRCPDCGTKNEIDKFTGRTLICKKCGATVEV